VNAIDCVAELIIRCKLFYECQSCCMNWVVVLCCSYFCRRSYQVFPLTMKLTRKKHSSTILLCISVVFAKLVQWWTSISFHCILYVVLCTECRKLHCSWMDLAQHLLHAWCL